MRCVTRKNDRRLYILIILDLVVLILVLSFHGTLALLLFTNVLYDTIFSVLADKFEVFAVSYYINNSSINNHQS
jgi:hypothetical protein